VPLGDVRAPFGGMIIYVIVSPTMSEGEPIAMIGAIRGSL
jgi:hypothetical protein